MLLPNLSDFHPVVVGSPRTKTIGTTRNGVVDKKMVVRHGLGRANKRRSVPRFAPIDKDL